MIKIQYVNDDWIRIYNKDKLLQEGHSIFINELLSELGFDVKSEYINECIYCEKQISENDKNKMGVPCCKNCANQFN